MDYGNVCNFCTVNIILSVIAFLIIIGSSSVYIYFHWYLKRTDTSITNINHNTDTIIYYTLIFASTDKNKELFKNIRNSGMGLKVWLKKINNKTSEYRKEFMKIKSNFMQKLYNLTIIVRSVFQEDNKYYPQ